MNKKILRSLLLLTLLATPLCFSSLAFSQSENSTAEIQGLINQAISSGSNLVSLGPQTYRLVCAGAPPSYCLSVNGAHGLRIQGVAGVTKIIIASPQSGIMSIYNSSQVMVTGIIFDYETPPFSQGTVVSVGQTDGPQSFTYVVDPGFPNPLDPSLASLVSGDAGGMIYSGVTGLLKFADPHIYVAVSTAPVSYLGNGVWQLSAYNANLSSLLAPGDRITLASRPSHGIVVDSSSDIKILKVSIMLLPRWPWSLSMTLAASCWIRLSSCHLPED